MLRSEKFSFISNTVENLHFPFHWSFLFSFNKLRITSDGFEWKMSICQRTGWKAESRWPLKERWMDWIWPWAKTTIYADLLFNKLRKPFSISFFFNSICICFQWRQDKKTTTKIREQQDNNDKTTTTGKRRKETGRQDQDETSTKRAGQQESVKKKLNKTTDPNYFPKYCQRQN